MSIGIAILLAEKKLPIEAYSAFVDACASVVGDLIIHEVEPLNLNADEIVHYFIILNENTKPRNVESRVMVDVGLERREFIKKYGRSRRKIYWQIYIETSAGRSPLSLAVQFLVPLQAFEFFINPVVLIDDSREKVFLEPKTYEEYSAREIALACGEGFLEAVCAIKSFPTKDEQDAIEEER